MKLHIERQPARPPESLLSYARKTDARGFVVLRVIIVSLLLLLVTPCRLFSDEPGETINKRFDNEIAELDAQVEKSPIDIDLYSRRGDARFFRGRFADAVADYEKMVELNRKLDTSHWRKGIAYFYAGRYKDAAHQFEIYHSFDNVDRENGIWRYLSQVKAIGRDKARDGLLKYEKDDREPFPDVYRLFSGELSGDDVLKRINVAEITPREKEQRLFYAELYVGLNDFVDGRLESAEKHLEQATKNAWGSKAGGGPGYMWHVGRVHHDLLVAEREKKPK
jgi:lipoprotein NlpI